MGPRASTLAAGVPDELVRIRVAPKALFESRSLLGILNEAIASSTNEIYVLRPDLSRNLGT